MSLQPKVTPEHNAAVDRMYREMRQRLQEAAGQNVREQLAAGRLKIVDGGYVVVESSLKFKRASILAPRPK